MVLDELYRVRILEISGIAALPTWPDACQAQSLRAPMSDERIWAHCRPRHLATSAIVAPPTSV